MTARASGNIDAIPMDATGGANHVFHAVAFVENLSLKDLASAYPEARRTPHELRVPRCRAAATSTSIRSARSCSATRPPPSATRSSPVSAAPVRG